MSRTLRIAQVSDCHLPASPDILYRGINAYSNLQRVLEKVAEFTPDLLLASGDLSEDASASSYRALKAHFAPLDVEVLALPGNHDEPQRVADSFPGSPVDELAVSEHGNWQIIRINSCIAGRPEGCISDDNLQQLASVLGQTPSRPRLLVLHHQPVLVGSPWIDKYCLLEADRLLPMLSAANGIRAVLWGHVHQAFSAVHQGSKLLSGPSSAINGLPGCGSFTADPAGPAFRWLELQQDGGLESGIIHA